MSKLGLPPLILLIAIASAEYTSSQEPDPSPPRPANPAGAAAGSSERRASEPPIPTAPAARQPGGPSAPSPAAPSTSPPGESEESGARRGLGGLVPLPIPSGRSAPPGAPSRLGRPRPGGMFDPGATGPGISQREQNFLDGALDPDTGWPFVFLDHFTPRPERVERFWVVDTRECPQEMGTDPWPRLRVRHFDAQGDLVEADPAIMFSQAAGSPVLIQVQGSLTTPDIALGGLLWTHSWLERHRAILPGTVVIAFDWPSQRVYPNDMRDINEKGRRAYIAGYHLARFVQAFPPQSRICLLGQSYGGRVVPSAVHLLGGGRLNSQDHDPEVGLPMLRLDLFIHAVVLAGASDHTWLNPCARLDRALLGCQAFLNLYNRRDEALRFYPLLRRSDHHHALGKVGLTNHDLGKLGPMAARYSEHDLHELLGSEHSLLDAVANPQVARWIAPYVWAPDPGPSEPWDNTERRLDSRGNRLLRGAFRWRGSSN